MKRDGIKVPQASAKPWEALGISRRTYYRHKAAGTLLRMPAAIIRASAIDLDTIDFSTFGIVAIRVMRGTEIMQEWNAP
jgi:hypothetical protein